MNDVMKSVVVAVWLTAVVAPTGSARELGFPGDSLLGGQESTAAPVLPMLSPLEEARTPSIKLDWLSHGQGTDAAGEEPNWFGASGPRTRLSVEARHYPVPGETFPFSFSDFDRAVHRTGYESVPGRLDLGARYSLALSRRHTVFGYLGMPGVPALGPGGSYLDRFGVEGREDFGLYGLGSNVRSHVLTFGYASRNLALESSTFSGIRGEPSKAEHAGPKLRRSSRRLTVSPTPDWVFRLSRGQIGSLDQLELNGRVRRTTLSATHRSKLGENTWQTTLAWGRNSRKHQESTVGYLLETSLKFGGAHAVVGRVEQVGSDELLRENESGPRQLFKTNKLTFGYLYELDRRDEIDVGALVSRYSIPSHAAASYGGDRTAYLVFIRFKLP